LVQEYADSSFSKLAALGDEKEIASRGRRPKILKQHRLEAGV
jgi:hypothetical protein